MCDGFRSLRRQQNRVWRRCGEFSFQPPRQYDIIAHHDPVACHTLNDEPLKVNVLCFCFQRLSQTLYARILDSTSEAADCHDIGFLFCINVVNLSCHWWEACKGMQLYAGTGFTDSSSLCALLTMWAMHVLTSPRVYADNRVSGKWFETDYGDFAALSRDVFAAHPWSQHHWACGLRTPIYELFIQYE